MPGVLYSPDNVAVGHAVMFYAPWVKGAVKPLVADATALFDPEPWETAGWLIAGATEEGFAINVGQETTKHTIEEQSTPVNETMESRTFGIEAALVEDTLATIRLAWNTTAATAAAGPPATAKASLSDEIAYYTVALETRNLAGLARRFYVPKATILGSGATSFRRSASKRTYPMAVSAVCAPSEIQIVDITA